VPDPDRRQCLRRAADIARATSLHLALCGGALLAPGAAEAQIYTRVNGNGVVEATNIPAASDFRLTYPGKGVLIHSRGFRRAYNGEYDNHILAASAAHGVSADLVRAVIQVESEFDPLAVSSKGAQGLMQLMPDTGRRFGVSDPFDPRQNIFAGVQYLRFLLDMFQGDIALAVAGYNAGENAVARFNGIPPYKETRSYVQKIQALLSGISLGIKAAVNTVGPAFYAPVPRAAPAKTSKPAKPVPARPRIYYKWKDQGGMLHVAQTPPEEGIVYTMIRALD
jgi:Transglycosylase SLT domain